MKFALFVLSTIFSFSAFSATFDISDARILGQYKLAKASKDAEIESIKIIYNTDNQLVLVRDNDVEYPLHAADSSGLIHQSADECNAGSGDEPDCYFDANFEVRLGSVRNSRGQEIPQITIDVQREDGYDANPAYSYQLKFNWSAEIEDAVPYYTSTENPQALQNLLAQCKNDYADVMGESTYSNRVCHEAESFKIRQGIDQQKALQTLLKDWKGFQVIANNKLPQIFALADKELANYVGLKKKGSVAELTAAALPVRDYMTQNSDVIATAKPVGGMTWVFALNTQSGIITRYLIFAR